MHRVIPFLRRVFASSSSPKANQSLNQAITESRSPQLLTFTREFLDNEVRENALTASTQKKYNTFHKNMGIFLGTKYRDRIITLADVDIPMMMEYKTWMHQNLKSCSLTHASKQIETIKRIMDHAVIMKHIPFNPIAPLKTKRDKKKEIVKLDKEELLKIEKAIFVCDEYYLVRDLYLFQCYTGLSYIDLWRYEIERNEVRQDGINKVVYLVTSSGGRGKNGRKYWSEFTPEAKYIHDKYKGEFPKIDNARYNRYLKELMNHIGIKKYLTTHTGRKTFATNKKKDGYSAPGIATMLGNTEQVARTDYFEEAKDNVINEILQIRGRKNGPLLN